MVAPTDRKWIQLIYRIPSQPSRYRLQVWRKLQTIGAAYLQDAVCILPDNPEHIEIFNEVAGMIREMGGSASLLRAEPLGKGQDDAVIEAFHHSADERFRTIISRVDSSLQSLQANVNMTDIEVAEESLMRERIAFLRAQRISYFGGTIEHEVEARIEQLRLLLDEIRAAILA